MLRVKVVCVRKRVSIHEGQAGLLSSKTARFACKCVYRADPPPHAPTNINGMFHGAEAAVLLTLSSSIRVSSHEVQRSVGLFHRPISVSKPRARKGSRAPKRALIYVKGPRLAH